MATDRPESSPAERAETIDALCSKLRWLAEILTGRRQFNSQVSETELTGVVEAMQQAADLLVSLHGQQASREQEREPSAWSTFGDGHDYSRTGKHDPLNCRPCLREQLARLKGEQR
jgi:hypothetical protein